MSKIRLNYCSLLLLAAFSLQCTQNKRSIVTNKNSNYSGDRIISFGDQKYFKSLTGGKGYGILKKQNNTYFKHFIKFKNYKIESQKNDVSVTLITEQPLNSENVKVNLITYIKNRKADSIQFYRKMAGETYGRYNCLSYFDREKNKIWQIKYFPSATNRPADIVSYSSSNISSSGIIKTDSVYYLDESLDAVMQKYNLYY